jgi:hypothetical protein
MLSIRGMSSYVDCSRETFLHCLILLFVNGRFETGSPVDERFVGVLIQLG